MASEIKIEMEEPPQVPAEIKDATEEEPTQEKEKDGENPEIEESQKLLQEEPQPPPESEEKEVAKKPSLYEISATLTRTREFTQKLRSISVEKPPTRNPFAYIAAVFGLCFTGSVVSLGICCCVGGFLLLEIVPIAAIVMGAVYWDRDKYCSAENIPLILIIGGVLKVLHITLSTAAGGEQSNGRKVVERMASKKKNKDKKNYLENPENPEQDEAKVEELDLEANKEDEVKENDEKSAIDEENEIKSTKSEDQAPQKTSTNSSANGWFRLGNSLLSLAEITWLITATVIIYGMYDTVLYSREDATVGNYCHKSLYRFAFFYVTFFYVLLGLLVLVPVCICCCGCMALLVSQD